MTKDMTSGSPLKMILFFSIPVLLGNLFQQFYNMVDTIIVGRYLGEEALAAVGSTGSLMFLVLGFANGIAQGFGVMISHAFGAKDFPLLKHYVALSLMLTVVVSVILTVPTVAASRDLLLWMHTPENIIGMADAYIKVIFAGIILTMLYNVLSGILRGIGDSKTPLYFLILSSVLNIVLDIFLIVNVNLGTAGAAYATIISQGVAAVLCFFYMFYKFDILRTSARDYYLDFIGIRKMLSIGIPMALNYSITAIGTMIMQSAVNVFGSSVVAAFTAASKVNNIATQTMPTLGTALATYCGQNLGAGKYKRIYEGMRQGFAFTAASKVNNIATQTMPTLGTALATYCGQNLGAGKYKRIYEGMRQGFFLCLAAALLAAAICIFGGRFIVSWFVSNPSEEIFTYAMQYLIVASWFFLPLAMIFLYRNALQGLNEGLIPMLSGAVELLCRFAVIALIPESAGFLGVCFADPAAWVGAALPLLITYLLWKRKKMRQFPEA